MADQPAAPLLLEVARETLLALLPQVDVAHHYTLRMVANAMAIAGREWAVGDTAALDAEARRLRDAVHAGAPAGLDVHAALRALTGARLAISNPRLSHTATRERPR